MTPDEEIGVKRSSLSLSFAGCFFSSVSEGLTCDEEEEENSAKPPLTRLPSHCFPFSGY